MRAGLFAGAVAAVIAALVSLPLHSPVDSVFNSATVTVATLILGGLSGLLWSRFSRRMLWYAGIMAGLFVVVVVIAFAGNNFLDRFVSFVAPLAAIAFAVTAALTPMLADYFSRPDLGWKAWSSVAAAVISLALGFGLVTQGDAESGDLALPPRPTAAASPTQPAEATQAPASSETGYAIGSDAYVVGEGSEITFTVEEELGRSPVRFDAVISSKGLTGVANLGGDEPSVVILDLHSLQSDQQFRDQYTRSRLFPDTPEAVVTVEQLPDLPQSFFDGQETTGTLGGSLQIGDTVTPLEFEVTARRDGSAINILGRTTFTWEQLGLPKPTARSVVYLADEVRVQVLLVARSQ